MDEIVEGIYEFTTSSGKLYVGQSKNILKRLKEHIRSGKLFADDFPYIKRTEVLGGRIAREIAEQKRLKEIVRDLYGSDLSVVENKRWPIGKARQHLLSPSNLL